MRGRVLALLLALGWCAPVHAQDYPAREIKVISGYLAGSGADVLTRYFAEHLHVLAGVPVIVENKPGALTIVAAEAVAHSRPDGYTMMITGGNATLASNPHLFKKLPYDPVKDFAPITTLIKLCFVLTVDPKNPATNVRELVAQLKAKAHAKHAYGSTFALIAGELFRQQAGIDLTQVAYRSAVQAVPDMLAGDIDFIFADSLFASEQIRQGLIRPLAVTMSQRSAAVPDVPGMAEAGFPDYDLSGWWGAWVPARTPPPVIAKLRGWLDQVVVSDETRQFLKRNGAEPWPGTTADLAAMLDKEIVKWGTLIRDAKIEPQ